MSTLRDSLQKKYGNAGRGMTFPFAIAKTYSHQDYTSKFSGIWSSANSIQTPPKIPLGVSGFVAETTDSLASFTINFKKPFTDVPTTLDFFIHDANRGYFLKFYANQFSSVIDIDTLKQKHIKMTINNSFDSIMCILERKPKQDAIFSFYGVSFKNEKPGILYHNFGVGGAIYSALLHQKYFKEQFIQIMPDIVVLDWGTNDIIYKNIIADTLYSTIKNTIAALRIIKSDIIIILPSVQDMNWKGKNVSVCKGFNDLIQRIANEENCFYYNWYEIAGGRNSMKFWELYQLARKDNIHLTQKGYILKAQLLYRAIQKLL